MYVRIYIYREREIFPKQCLRYRGPRGLLGGGYRDALVALVTGLSLWRRGAVVSDGKAADDGDSDVDGDGGDGDEDFDDGDSGDGNGDDG